MSHKANDIIADNKLDEFDPLDTEDTSEYWKEQEDLSAERMEEVYDNQLEPSCGTPPPFWAQ